MNKLSPPVDIKDALVPYVSSKSELRRLITQKAITEYWFEGIKGFPYYERKERLITDINQQVDGECMFKIGKKKFIKCKEQDSYLISAETKDSETVVGFKELLIYEI